MNKKEEELLLEKEFNRGFKTSEILQTYRLEREILEEKAYCEQKLKALKKSPYRVYTALIFETTTYWEGRIDQLDFALSWIEQ